MDKRKKYFFWGFFFLLLYFLPNLIQGEGSVIKVHDFLDSSIAHIRDLIRNGAVFDMDATMPILCGIKRGVFGSPFNLKIWIFCLLPPYWAIITNLVLIKVTAFAGLFLLLTRHVFRENNDATFRAAFIASLCFAFVPFYPDYGISSAGIPLVACAFMNLYRKKYIPESAVLLLYYAVYSYLILSGFFVCVTVAVAWLILLFRDRKPSWPLFWGLFYFSVLLILTESYLFLSFFSQAEPTHRAEFSSFGPIWLDVVTSLSTLLLSWYHAGSCLAVLVVVPFLFLWKKERDQKPYLNLPFSFFILVAGLIVAGALMLAAVLKFHLFQGFQTDRFFFLYPAVVFTLLGVLLLEWGKSKASAWMIAILMVFNLGADFHWRDNMAQTLGVINTTTFRQYYDEPLFNRLKSDMGFGPQTKVACLGFHPAVAEYNGLYTVDSYFHLYPVSYKHRFQKVIQGELDKSQQLKDYFNNYGQRCYLFCSEVGLEFVNRKDESRKIHNLSIDCDALREDIGCQYILSSIAVENYADLGLRHCGSWTEEDSFWEIHVYQL